MKIVRNERFDMTLSSEEKEAFTEAAELEGFSTLSQFVRAVVTRAARRIRREHSELFTSMEDRKRFRELMLNPPEPNEALVDLLKHGEDRFINRNSHKEGL